jgi:hypothetical protein
MTSSRRTAPPAFEPERDPTAASVMAQMRLCTRLREETEPGLQRAVEAYLATLEPRPPIEVVLGVILRAADRIDRHLHETHVVTDSDLTRRCVARAVTAAYYGSDGPTSRAGRVRGSTYPDRTGTQPPSHDGSR